MNNLIKRLNKFEEGVLAYTLLAIAIFTFIETALRYTISYTFTWFNELANYTIIFCTYLGASIGVKYGTHFSMEALTEYCPDKVSHLLKTAAYFLSGMMAVLFVYYGTEHLFRLKSFGVKSSAMQIPMYIPYIPIPLFSISIALRFFALSYRHFNSFRKGEPFERIRRK
ncbi:MAG: TRAP transporter small permease [Proteobacteria bacterium]|nr:TRAP transporter small permease [Pseudomonadota bacterium]MCG2740284.1 TRAP transporter small permease [Syntrophaceae bacterium]MBU1743873.1 TRAP transporter small permease [Pseudomonadota bacterium]MBU1964776.1 TRAP transporter small permease [Pseudomonadota bacterium]MBU4371259.1 TRAP transporter small permease [Pseudomonadota bacterium]